MKKIGWVNQVSVSILFVATTLSNGCENSNEFKHQVLSLTQIGQGDLYGNGAENISQQNIVITDNSSWVTLVNAMNTINNVSESFTEVNIDFDKYQIIAAFDNIKQNSGHSIDITKVTETKNNLIIVVENLQKGGLNSTITQPFHIIKISKSTKHIVFSDAQ